MLRRLTCTALPRDPLDVRLLHHTSAGVVIAAVRYAPAAAPLFFTVAEMPAPNEGAQPLHIMHVRVPAPATAVTGLVLLRSADGSDVFVVVHATHASGATTYVYRRQLARARTSAAEELDGEADEEEATLSPTAELRVRYQRLPRAFSSPDAAAPWTAAAAFLPSENMLVDDTDATAAFLTASAGDGVSVEGGCRLQLWSLHGTRLSLDATWTVPALLGFTVDALCTLPGTQDAALLRYHNAVLEVDLAGLRRAARGSGGRVTGNAFLARAWRWSPHERLTACAVKDALLFAATEEGAVLVWDLRQPTTTTAALAAVDQHRGPPPLRSAAVKTAITGLYAPYATGFITCDASGGVRDWRERVGGGHEAEAEEGALRDVAGAAAAAAIASTQFPYVARAPVEAAAGAEPCVALDGHDNFAAAVGEAGRLSIYFCD